jgi:hypothetical protein
MRRGSRSSGSAKGRRTAPSRLPTISAIRRRSSSGNSGLLPVTRARRAHGLVEQVPKPDVVARAGLQRLAVFAEHGPEIDVLELRHGPAPLGEPLARGEEKLLEVIRLALVDDVEDAVAPKCSERYRIVGQVGGGVVGGAVRLAHDHGLRLEARVLRMENDLCALAGRRDPGGRAPRRCVRPCRCRSSRPAFRRSGSRACRRSAGTPTGSPR